MKYLFGVGYRNGYLELAVVHDTPFLPLYRTTTVGDTELYTGRLTDEEWRDLEATMLAHQPVSIGTRWPPVLVTGFVRAACASMYTDLPYHIHEEICDAGTGYRG
jgi:hypothetical protein